MSAELSQLAELPKQMISEVKNEAKPATKDGIVKQAVGFALGIPVSMFYDWLYDMVASKVLTNAMARNVLKIVFPAGVGLVVQVAKLPFGNIIAGTGYAVSLIVAVKLLVNWIKTKFGKKSVSQDAFDATSNETSINGLWGVQE